MTRKDWFPFLKTLRRLPDDVVLDMATREFAMHSEDACLCGWALRASLSRLDGKAPEEFSGDDWDDPNTDTEIVRLFGGTPDEWRDIYVGVTEKSDNMWDYYVGRRGKLPEIERAFIERVAEACR